MDKKVLQITILFFFIPCLAFAQHFGVGLGDFGPDRAYQIFTDTGKFNGILGASDVTVQSALQSLSALAGASGISVVHTVGDCSSPSDGVCLDGTSDGGTKIEFYQVGGSTYIYYEENTGSSDTYTIFDGNYVSTYVNDTLFAKWGSGVNNVTLNSENVMLSGEEVIIR